MKRFILIPLFFFVAGFIFAQNNVGQVDPALLTIDAAQQHLREVSVDRFEFDGFWRAHISMDDGFVTTRQFRGGPANREPIPGEENIPDEHVLGVRVDFIRRSLSSLFITPLRPIQIEGITRTVSVWVAGRNFNHRLYLLGRDFHGREFELYMGRLNFQGWQRLTVAIPPQDIISGRGIIQRHYHQHNHMGLSITGLRVDFDMMQAFGSHYLYFDDMRAVTDLFAELHRDEDDMQDGW